MKQRGFTLIELLVTIAVLVIMATIAIPNFQSLAESSRRAADYNEILAGLNYARSEAVKRRENIDAVITNPDLDGRWLLEIKDASGVLRKFSANDSRVSVDSGSVTFNALGRRGTSSCTWNDNCILGITYGKELKIQVRASGKIGPPDA